VPYTEQKRGRATEGYAFKLMNFFFTTKFGILEILDINILLRAKVFKEKSIKTNITRF
jgi:hypothetical protein